MPTLAKLRLPTDPHSSRAQDSIGAAINPTITALARTPIMGAKPPSWVPISFASTSFQTIGNAVQTAFHHDALGYVWVRIFASVAGGAGAGASVLTMPVSSRPAFSLDFLGLEVVLSTLLPLVVSPTGIITTTLAIGPGSRLSANFSYLAEQ